MNVLIWIVCFSIMYLQPDTFLYQAVNIGLTCVLSVSTACTFITLLVYFNIIECDDSTFNELKNKSVNYGLSVTFATLCIGSTLLFGLYHLAEAYLFNTYLIYLAVMLIHTLNMTELKKKVLDNCDE